MTRIIALLAIVAVALAACAGTRSLTIDDNEDRVSLSPGDEVQVTLDGNATTGFIWELAEYDSAVIDSLGEPTYEEETGDVVGAGGTWTWTLHAVGEGESMVRFVYHRTWEEKTPESVFSFTAAVGR